MQREDDAVRYLASLARRIGAQRAVIASGEGLLIAGAGASSEVLEELAVSAPSQRPTSVKRPPKMTSCRIDLDGERVYLATIGAPIPADAPEDLARILGA